MLAEKHLALAIFPEYSLISCGLWHYSSSYLSDSHLLSSATLDSPLCPQYQSTAIRCKVDLGQGDGGALLWLANFLCFVPG